MITEFKAIGFQKDTSQLLAEIKAAILELKQKPDNIERLDKCHECWHKIKNLAALFDFTGVLDVAHEMEGYFFPISDDEAGKLSDKELDIAQKAVEYIEEITQKKIEDGTDLNQIYADSFFGPEQVAHLYRPETKTAGGQPYRIMIVDDEPINIALLENHIRDHFIDGHVEVISVSSAEEGLYHFFTKEFSLVFLDIMMPVIDGNDFIAIVERNRQQKNIASTCKIMVQTAVKSISQLTDLAQKESVHEIIRKPITQKRIKECLERYCPVH